MPFGAHEAMEVHEILTEKINMINHFHMYAAQAKDPQLKEMIHRHLQEEIKSYDTVVSYTHDYQNFAPMSANTNMGSVKPNQIQYGLDNPSMVAPEANTTFNDFEIASALLICHKNGAANGVKATLEIADPNLRQVLLNGAVNCVNQAYEVFLFMNQQGQYQIPTMKDHTAKTYLHSFQPVSESLKAQYVVNPGQPQGIDQAMMGSMMGNAPMNQTINQQMNQPLHVSRTGQNMVPMGQMGGIPTSVTIQHGQNPMYGQNPMHGQMLGNQTNMQQGSQHYNH
ncbi:spore coat protein [Neobacillus cucumis]|uniref:spore coat protein n=1 Tax=Neobacillus cucumis TaxID=1740721 RepID=UPI002853706C|nr:spore coat protein [Neobacillus cucumis]MDR4947615.1 spore coat protein [Neobacillus cucumis]